MSKNKNQFVGDFCELPLILNVNHIVSLLGISRAYAYEILHDQTLPVIVIGKRRLVERDQFRRWLDTHKEAKEA